METKDSKKIIRKEIRAERAAHTDEKIHRMSLEALNRFLKLSEYQKAKVIYAYMDCKHEVETRDLIRAAWSEGKRVAVPKVIGEEMKFFYITSFEKDLEDGYFGIKEPREENPAEEENALLLMPGVAFDEQCHRIGYGGGFYDRYLEAHPGLVTVALAFEFQIRNEVPYETFDIQPSKIVTEERVISR